MKSRVIFRADGDSTIGWGHVIRSLAFAEILKDDFDCYFVRKDGNPAFDKEINAVCKSIYALPVDLTRLGEAKYIRNNILVDNDICVLDGYFFDTAYQQELKSEKNKVVCIDDIAKFHFKADVIINQAGGVDPDKYSAEPYTRFALGPKYALLRKAFRDKTKQIKKVNELKNIFICFGGADENSMAYRMVALCQTISKIKEIHVVSPDKNITKLAEVSRNNNQRIYTYKNLSAAEMAEVMDKCHLAICPSSGIAYEVCSVGLGFITGIHADNQKNIATYLSSSGTALSIGDFRVTNDTDLKKTIEAIDISLINEQIKNQKSVFRSSELQLQKIIKKLALELNISRRRANENDAMTYFNWTNDPLVRQNSVNKADIALEDHLTWFNSKLNSRNTIFYIFEMEKAPVGQVRFDVEDEQYTINYSIDSNYRGRGLSDVLIKMAIEGLSIENKGKMNFYAIVKEGNNASSKAFHSNSFQYKGLKQIENTSYEVYQK